MFEVQEYHIFGARYGRLYHTNRAPAVSTESLLVPFTMARSWLIACVWVLRSIRIYCDVQTLRTDTSTRQGIRVCYLAYSGKRNMRIDYKSVLLVMRYILYIQCITRCNGAENVVGTLVDRC